MTHEEMPDGWVLTSLSSIVEYGKTTKSSRSDVGEHIWVLELEDIEKDSSRILQRVQARDRPFKSTKNNFKKGDVLYGKLRPYLNKVVVADDDGVCSTEIVPINAEPYVHNRYLFHWLKSKQFLDYVNDVSYGVNMPRLGTQDGLAAPVVVCPLAEQKVIAEKLDTLLAQVESTKAHLERIPDILKRFRQSVLSAAVSGKLTADWRRESSYESSHAIIDRINQQRESLKKLGRLKKNFGPEAVQVELFEGIPETWSWVSFAHLAEHHDSALKAGPFGSALKKSDYVSSGYRVYGQEQVIAGDEALVTYYINDEKYQQLISCAVAPGDILISLVGTIGKVLILSSKVEQGIINPRLVKLTLQPEVQREYVKYYLESPPALSFFKGFSHGGTMDILNLKILKELPIPFPPLEEQKEIVRIVAQYFSIAAAIEDKTNSALSEVSKLTTGILSKAFHGELTSNWRDNNQRLISGDYSASSLLSLITEERKLISRKSKKSRSK